MKHICCYVLANSTYCGQPTKYKIKLDDDGNRLRVYDSFCPRHRTIVDAREIRDEESDDTEL